tara:strand:+ start:271 stop:555 length:285 start_codon:yes stop_codon:yes gene_type:complete
MENYRILANPCLLADEKRIDVKTSFRDKLKEIISHEYNEIYIPQIVYDKIENSIKNNINDLVIDQIINETLNTVIESIVNDCKDKKFDFFIPFD